ncbi:MAG: exodeoxyribonuclease VII large subunit [Eggerthellaceae bacterium]|nr:exodeoxyribonuclease VII large subunit [Eggerthellaceae bacterium]
MVQAETENKEAPAAFTVSQAMTMAQHALEAVTVRILGEVSEVSVKPGYKAAYFTVKDTSASLPCMMWNNRYRASGVQLEVGQLVELTGRFTLYAAKGRMNFDVFSIALSGEGELRMRVANIARKLEAEGLTSPSRKRRLPRYPEAIGLVTSPRSAAVHDVLRTLRRRYPVARVLLAGVPVEGANAPAGIAEGIRCVADAGAQVVLVVRGGGSFEDLMPFNDESLARAIASCPVPVVTGIGHEVDTTIADMVSDYRASTPTAAAETVSPSREQLNAFIESRGATYTASAKRAIERLSSRVGNLAARPYFVDPRRLFASESLSLDVLSERYDRALPSRMEREKAKIGRLLMRLEHSGGTMLDGHKARTGIIAARIDTLSPLSTLARGYSIARSDDGKIVRSVSQVCSGKEISVQVTDGMIDCLVQGISELDMPTTREGD